MTESEAIKFLNNYVIDTRMGMEVIAKTNDFLNVCEKALEKQILKKPDKKAGWNSGVMNI